MMKLIRGILLMAAALTVCAVAFADDYPVYQNGVLTLPRVDSPDQVGKYQDVRLQWLGAPQNAWALTSVQTLGVSSIFQVKPDKVDVIKAGTLPVSVYLRASGYSDDCFGYNGPDRNYQRLVGTRFEVNISYPVTPGLPPSMVCAASVHNFTVTIPLQVYGLAAGTYTYDVNGVTGSFTLDSDNKFADDCALSPPGTNCVLPPSPYPYPATPSVIPRR